MKAKYYVEECNAIASSDSDKETTVTIQQFRGVFYILGAGIVISLICLAVQVRSSSSSSSSSSSRTLLLLLFIAA